ncbi:hypothetical protein SUGI_0948120 [Cryptomeria japonica]|nr:hypothetical protein SUGI_0948120 [Cryptomeria japonica]
MVNFEWGTEEGRGICKQVFDHGPLPPERGRWLQSLRLMEIGYNASCHKNQGQPSLAANKEGQPYVFYSIASVHNSGPVGSNFPQKDLKTAIETAIVTGFYFGSRHIVTGKHITNIGTNKTACWMQLQKWKEVYI